MFCQALSCPSVCVSFSLNFSFLSFLFPSLSFSLISFQLFSFSFFCFVYPSIPALSRHGHRSVIFVLRFAPSWSLFGLVHCSITQRLHFVIFLHTTDAPIACSSVIRVLELGPDRDSTGDSSDRGDW